MFILASLNLPKLTSTLVWTIIGLGVIPVIALWVGYIITLYYQRIFNSTLGPHTQALVGGLGAGIHELAQIVMACITGHSIKYAHFQALTDIRQGMELNNTDHNWASHHVAQDLGDFALGVVPVYIISWLIMMWQKVLGGTPFPAEIKTIGLHSYLNVTLVLRTLMYDANTAFHGIGFISFIPFFVGMVLLGSCGLVISQNECVYASRGLIVWIVFIIIIDALASLGGKTSMVLLCATVFTNFSVCIMMRTIMYALIMGIIIGFLNLYSKVTALLHR